MSVIHGPDSGLALIPPDRHRKRVALEVLLNVVALYAVPLWVLRLAPLAAL